MNTFSDIEAKKPSGITLRTLLIGLILIIANLYWIISTSVIWDSLIQNYISLFTNTIFTLFVLVLLNLLLKKFLKIYALQKSELLVIYVMLVMVSTLSGATNIGRLIPALTHPFWFATAENEWKNLFLGYIPKWFTVQDRNVLSSYFEGNSSFFATQNIKSWLVPILFWSTFMFVLYFVLICINTIIRKELIEYERLTYPITQLPLEMVRDTTAFFFNKLMWMGFGIAASIEILNGLSFLYPAIPSVRMRYINIGSFFREKPWNAIGTSFIFLSPFLIGLSFFMPLDLSFSSWFFYLLGKAQLVFMSIIGWRTLYSNEQAEGAWIGLGILALWIGRKHLKQVFTKAITGKGEVDDSREPMRYRTALFGIISGMLFLFFFAYKAALSLWVFLLFFGIYFLMAISLTKVRAGLGPPLHEVILKEPAGTMVSAMGTRVFGGRNLTILSFFYWLNRENVAHPMPNQLEAFRIGEQANINNRKLLLAMLISLAVGIPVSFLMTFSLLYNHGAARAPGFLGSIGWETFNRLQNWLNYPATNDYAAMSAMGIGFGFTMFLSAMKMRFIWWPFHPIGYVIGTGVWGDMSFIWFPVLVSWVIKFAILRYGGLQAYRKAIPFFAGLILGDYIVGGAWSIIGMAFSIQTYNIWLS